MFLPLNKGSDVMKKWMFFGVLTVALYGAPAMAQQQRCESHRDYRGGVVTHCQTIVRAPPVQYGGYGYQMVPVGPPPVPQFQQSYGPEVWGPQGYPQYRQAPQYRQPPPNLTGLALGYVIGRCTGPYASKRC